MPDGCPSVQESESGAARNPVPADSAAPPSFADLIDQFTGSGAGLDAKRSRLRQRVPFVTSPGDEESLGRLAQYEVLEIVAQGNGGTILKALEPGRNRIVAIRVLSAETEYSDQAKERFELEANTISSLDHPNILPVYTVNRYAPVPYLAMRYVEGTTLAQRLQTKTSLPLDEIVCIGKALAAGLAAAHGRGLIHLDLKPSNVFLETGTRHGESRHGGQAAVATGNSECEMRDAETHGADLSQESATAIPDSEFRIPGSDVLLTDFGTSEAVHDEANPRATTPFMSPEQAAGAGALDYRSDLFSLGSLLYTLAAGKTPFESVDIVELAEKIQSQAPAPLHEVVPGIPAWFSNLVAHLLAKQPSHRPASAANVGEILAEERDLGPPALEMIARLPEGKKPPLVLWTLGALGALVLVATVFVALEKSGRTAIVNRLLCERRGHPAYISGAWGTHATLADAVAIAKPFDEVVLRTAKPLIVYPIQIRDKPLVIRAGRGTRPVLFGRSDGLEPLISTTSDLLLEGLVIYHEFRSITPPPVVRGVSNNLAIANCRLVRTAIPAGKIQSAEHACVHVSNGLRLSIANSEFYAAGSPLVFSEKTKKYRVTAVVCRNSIFRGEGFAFVERTSGTVKMDLRQNEFFGTIAIALDPKNPPRAITIEAANNLFHLSRDLILTPDATEEQLRKRLRWFGAENIFIVGEALARFSGPGGASINDLNGWRRFLQSDVMEPSSVYSAEMLVDDWTYDSEDMPKQPYSLAVPAGLFPETPIAGALPAFLGPGAPYARWVPDPGYRAWRKDVTPAPKADS